MVDITKWFTPGINLVPQDGDPTNPNEGDLFMASIAHGTRDPGLYHYINGDWADAGSNDPIAPVGAHGYFISGRDGSSSTTNNYDKFTYGTEAIANLAVFLTTRSQGSSVYDFASKGFCMGGANGNGASLTTQINKVDTATDIDTTIGAVMAAAKDDSTGVSSATKGYVLAGSGSTSIEAITHAAETMATLGATTATSTRKGCGLENATDGYMGGAVGPTATVYKFGFGAETGANIAGVLSTARSGAEGGTDYLTKGFFMGGKGGSDTAVIDKITYATDVVAVSAATLDNSTEQGHSAISSATTGYMALGSTTGFGVVYTEIDDMIIAAETSAAIIAVLTVGASAGFGLTA